MEITQTRRDRRAAAASPAGSSSLGRNGTSALVAALVALVVGGSWWSAGRMESDLQRRGCTALAGAGLAGSGVVYSGRDAVVGDVADVRRAAAVITTLADVRGTRAVRVADGARRPAAGGCPGAAAAAPAAGDGGPAPDGAAVEPVLSVRFGTDSASLDSTGRAMLDALLVYLEAHPAQRISVDGHADNTGLDGRNLPLSRERANAVTAYLVEHGVVQSIVTATGHGSIDPVVPNTTSSNRALNRRVDVTIEEKQ